MRLQQARGNRPSPTERRLCPSGSSLAPSRSTPPAPNCSFLHKLCALPFSLPAPSTQPCPVVKFLPSQGEVAELRSSGKRTEWLQKKSPDGWMSSSLLGTAQISADPSPQGLPSPRPTVWRLREGLAWPPLTGPHRLTSPHPQLHQYQLSATLPRHRPAPSRHHCLSCFTTWNFSSSYLLGDCYHLSKLRSVSLKPPNPPSACKGHRTPSLPLRSHPLAHRAQSHWAPSHPSSCEAHPAPGPWCLPFPLPGTLSTLFHTPRATHSSVQSSSYRWSPLRTPSLTPV